MNELTQTAVVSMTTVEIAERTGKKHDHVLADTQNMLTELYGEGKCLVLMTEYSIPLRSDIIKRLEELEAGITPTPVAILPETKLVRLLQEKRV
jgi:hypothetical protein